MRCSNRNSSSGTRSWARRSAPPCVPMRRTCGMGAIPAPSTASIELANSFGAVRVIELETIADLRGWVRGRRASGARIALVPTMGYLHEGHLRLVDAARQRADAVV